MEEGKWKVVGGLVIVGGIIVGPAVDVCCWDDRQSGVTATDTANEAAQLVASMVGVTSTMNISMVSE